jgi:hypothetical protein
MYLIITYVDDYENAPYEDVHEEADMIEAIKIFREKRDYWKVRRDSRRDYVAIYECTDITEILSHDILDVNSSRSTSIR